ncbi:MULTISPECIES: CitMHS family transporter [Streptomyces]|uniref:CitMHS family transporter n=1 Tax=Streptomyces TaxID=1883 RepID=UPI0007874867|nr:MULTISPECIES: citrate:proton symporter [unclassified Streptomyces]AVH94320.1 damage-inducible protein CinA [Streptomyces sp. WAC00288]KYG51257.1 damage-inducible protein CinA [Streptomyces sp. WAC04657]
MLAALGFATLASFMLLVMRKYLSAFTAIMLTPIAAALIAGKGSQLGDMIMSGLETVAPTAALLLFAVLYFGLMMEMKLFDPVCQAIVRASKGDPVRIVVGTAVLSICIALDGDGTTSYMIVCSAFLPIYRRLGMNPLILATLAAMALGTVSGTTPWGGAATRGISVLHLSATEYFVHMIGPMALTSLAIIAVAYWLGLRERRKIDNEKLNAYKLEIASGNAFEPVKADWRMWFNAALTAVLMVLLVLEVADLLVLFMVGFVIALLINVRVIADQQELIKRQAANAVPVVILVLAAGVFTGIMTDSGMIKAMANAALSVVPDGMGNLIPLVTAVLALPLGFFMSNDAYWFGVVPVLAESASHYGISPNEIARAGAIGQILHMMGPTSAPLWVLLGLVKAELGDFQKHALRWGIPVSLAYIAFALITGAISI